MGIKISIFLRSARKSGTLFEMSASGSGTRKKIGIASGIGTLFFADEREREWHSKN